MPRNLKGWIILIALVVALWWGYKRFIRPALNG